MGFPQYISYLLGGQSASIEEIKTKIGLKSVQRGVSAGAGTATITAVDLTKATIKSVSKGSAGVVATNSTVPNQQIATTDGAFTFSPLSSQSSTSTGVGRNNATGVFYARGGAMSGGATDLVTKQYSAVLTNATTVTFDGPCEWEVAETY